ncbi:hypothetical protein TNCV_3025591 [Trichonephila clavipes]|nr:hypothetical protein TNCV_3025591 [Trichonephila clavipes]
MFGIPSKRRKYRHRHPPQSWLQEITLTITSFILRFLVRGLVFRNEEKADCFVDNLEESFTENRTPYDDDPIDKVDRTIRRFLNNYSSSIPPLTSPSRNLRHHLQIKHTQSPRSRPNQNIAQVSPNERNNHLTKIFNKCLLLQHFPQIWKHCTISLLPKKNKDPRISVKLSSNQPHLLRRQTL